MHELSTNAAKYGALSNSAGRVQVIWSTGTDTNGHAIFTLMWQEQHGPPVTKPDQTGFGHTVIHRVVKAALAGVSELEFPPDGVKWRLVIPATHVIVANKPAS